MPIIVTTPPAQEPFTVARARAENALIHEEDDPILEAKIKAARQHVERILGKALVTQTWALILADFPSVIELPGGNVQEVESVEYYDTDGELQTIDPGLYEVDLFSQPARVRMKSGAEWPATAHTWSPVRVTYVVGYGDPGDVPEDIKAAILLIVGDLYQNREGKIVGTIQSDNPAVKALLFPFRTIGV